MINLIIVTHGELSKGLVSAAQVIVGKTDNITVHSLNPGDNITDFEKQVKNSIIEKMKEGHVLVLTDIPGGSPTNVSIAAMQDLDFECLTGTNLGMLLEAITARGSATDFKKYVEQVMDAGTASIHNLKKELQ